MSFVNQFTLTRCFCPFEMVFHTSVLYNNSLSLGLLMESFTAYITATRSMIGYWHHSVICLSVCLSVCDDVYCGAQGRCRG